MRYRTLLVVLGTLALAACGGDDESQTATVTAPAITRPAPPDSEPRATVTVPEPEPGAGSGRCSVRNLDVPGLRALFTDGATCAEGEAVVLAWLDECAGEDGPCEPMAGYRCTQERFAGSRSDVICTKQDGAVRFSFD